jgi:DNA-binding SARP family transcriptional activator/tetratricopeptide (TPR) repeat protein
MALAYPLEGDVGDDSIPGSTTAVGLLGPVCVYDRGESVPAHGAKQQLLLALLALSPGRTISTDRLVDALWGEAPPATAQTALRVHIARLRELLASLRPSVAQIVHRPPGYALDVCAECVDSVNFCTLLSAAREADPRATLIRLENALALWRGDPYGGMSDNELLRIEGQRLRGLYEAALEDRAEVLLQLGENEAAAAQLEALVRNEPLRERRTRLLMIALYRCGRQAAALDVYGRLRRMLDSELGLTPSPELQAIQRAVLTHDSSLQLLAPPEPTSALLSSAAGRLPWWLETSLDTTMFGRERLLGDLTSQIAEKGVQDNESAGVQIILLRGEAGVGKSRLLAELARRMMDRGVRVLAGWCDPEAIIPFRPMAEAFRPMVERDTADIWPSSVTKAADRVARFFTEADQSHQRSDPETDRLRYFEGMTNLLHEAAYHYSLLLAIDDIHWLDASSAALLRFLVRQPAHHPVLLLASYRSDPGEHTAAWARTLDELQRLRSCSLVEVTELTPDAAVSIITDVVPDFSAERVDALAQRILPVTGGNPLFVREIALQMSGAGQNGPDQIPVPRSMLAAVIERLHSISPTTHDVVNAAAVLGQNFNLDDVAVVAGCSARVALASLDEAHSARLVNEVPNSIDQYTFRHALLREAVHSLMPNSRRVRAHFDAGRAFDGRDDMRSVVAKAFHLIEAVPLCPPETAALASIDAADAALARLAFEEAARVILRALELRGSNPSISNAANFDLLIRLGRARSYRGENAASDEAFVAAAGVARALDDPTRLATAALGDDLDTRPLTPSPARLSLLEEALRAMGEQDSALHIAVASAYVSLASLSRGSASVRALADATVVSARRLADPLALSKALLAWLTCTNAVASPSERLAVATEALEQAESAGNSSRAARARLTRMSFLFRLGRAHDAQAEYGRYRALAESTRVPRYLWHADVAAAAIGRLLGRFGDAQAAAERALATGQKFEVAEAGMVFAVHEFFIHLHQGRLDELRPKIDAFAASRPDLISWTLSAALAASASDDVQAARQTLDRFANMLPELDPDAEFWSDQLMLATQLACELDAGPDIATLLWDRLIPRRGEFEVFGATTATLGPVDRALGGLAGQRGKHDDACRLFRASFDLCQQMGSSTWLVWTGADLAAELLRAGRRGEAHTIAETVAPTARSTGMERQYRRLTQTLQARPGDCGQSKRYR